jgi:hypothetical protein
MTRRSPRRRHREDFDNMQCSYFDGADPPAHFTIKQVPRPGGCDYRFGCRCGASIQRWTTPTTRQARDVEAFARNHQRCAA